MGEPSHSLCQLADLFPCKADTHATLEPIAMFGGVPADLEQIPGGNLQVLLLHGPLRQVARPQRPWQIEPDEVASRNFARLRGKSETEGKEILAYRGHCAVISLSVSRLQDIYDVILEDRGRQQLVDECCSQL